MTNLPPQLNPENDRPNEHDEGSLKFIVGPRDNPDGTPVKMTPEVLRRLLANKYLAQEFAKKFGLQLEGHIDSDPAKVEDSQRSKEITKAANPAMADVALKFRRSRQTLEVKADGSLKATNTHIEISARAALAEAIEAIASLLTKPFKWSGRVVMKFGKWVRATVAASNDEGERNS